MKNFDLEDLIKDRERILKDIYEIKMRCGRPLPAKVPISRTKTHWDCLLDEMVFNKNIFRNGWLLIFIKNLFGRIL